MPNLLLGAGADAGGGSAAPPTIPVNTVAPAITGTTTVGSTLTVTTGTWTNSPTSYSYQWYSGSSQVGSNQNTYALVSGDIGNSIDCVVTASNALYSGTATSNTVGPITAGTTTGTPLGLLLSITTASGGGGGSTPSLDFSQATNSEYYYYLYLMS